jgi:hypothetical protein
MRMRAAQKDGTQRSLWLNIRRIEPLAGYEALIFDTENRLPDSEFHHRHRHVSFRIAGAQPLTPDLRKPHITDQR